MTGTHDLIWRPGRHIGIDLERDFHIRTYETDEMGHYLVSDADGAVIPIGGRAVVVALAGAISDRFTAEAERALAIALYVAYYNARRPHIALDRLTPLDWLRRRVTKVSGDLI